MLPTSERAGLRCHGLTAPGIINRLINRACFDIWVETQLAPALVKVDIVILDNLAVHKSAPASRCLKNKGARFLFLPPYSPDLILTRLFASFLMS